MDSHTLEELAFHWEKWTRESKSFWRRTSAISGVLFYIIYANNNNNETHLRSVAICALLLTFQCFCFVDLMRHRVPEHLEPLIHNNRLKVLRFSIPLKKAGHVLYYILFLLYFGIGAGWLISEATRTLTPF